MLGRLVLHAQQHLLEQVEGEDGEALEVPGGHNDAGGRAPAGVVHGAAAASETLGAQEFQCGSNVNKNLLRLVCTT